MHILAWNRSDRYLDGWYLGSENEDGSHRRDWDGWPYSIYRRANQLGVDDVVLCHGIQDMKDASELCGMLNAQWNAKAL